MALPPFGTLRYLYVGSSNVGRDLEYYVKVLGSNKVWDLSGFGARVAAVEICKGPLLLLGSHRSAPSCLPVFQVGTLKASAKELKGRGWKPDGGPFEIPNGPCYVFKDPSGNQLAIFQEDRPRQLEMTAQEQDKKD